MKDRQITPTRLATLAFSVLLLALSAPAALAQSSALDAYVDEALANNLALRQQRLDLDRSVAALAEARGRFLPSVDLEARYTRAGGGRAIDLPLGDLLNPVYGTLNDLLAAQGRDPAFPTLANEEIAFLRTREQDTRLRVVQPLYQPRIRHAYRIQQHLVASQEAAVEAYRRTLVRDVKTAYYGYLQAEQAVLIYGATGGLVQENLRVNERLVAAEAETHDAVYRAQAEALEIEQQTEAARRDRDRARSYFNFLLNRPLDTPIQADPVLDGALADDPTALTLAALGDLRPRSALQELAAERRAELDQLAAASQAAERSVGLARSAFLPGVAFALDVGTQGTAYTLADEGPFYLASVVLQWNLFRGGQDRAAVQQARLQAERLRVERADVARQIDLQVQEAHDAVEVARRALRTADGRVEAARSGFRLTARRHAEGLASQVVYLDARTTLTRAELNLAVTRYAFLTRLAELEYAAALYPVADASPLATR